MKNESNLKRTPARLTREEELRMQSKINAHLGDVQDRRWGRRGRYELGMQGTTQQRVCFNTHLNQCYAKIYDNRYAVLSMLRISKRNQEE